MPSWTTPVPMTKPLHISKFLTFRSKSSAQEFGVLGPLVFEEHIDQTLVSGPLVESYC